MEMSPEICPLQLSYMLTVSVGFQSGNGSKGRWFCSKPHTHTHTSMVQNKKIVRRCDLANREYFTHYGMAKYFAPWVKLLY